MTDLVISPSGRFVTFKVPTGERVFQLNGPKWRFVVSRSTLALIHCGHRTYGVINHIRIPPNYRERERTSRSRYWHVGSWCIHRTDDKAQRANRR